MIKRFTKFDLLQTPKHAILLHGTPVAVEGTDFLVISTSKDILGAMIPEGFDVKIVSCLDGIKFAEVFVDGTYEGVYECE